MTLKKKLTLGLGFLFLIIFVLVVFYSYYISKLSQDADNILKANYNSIVYSKNMSSALDDMKTAMTSIVFNPTGVKKLSDYHLRLFEEGKADFEKNLKEENNNITEIHEKEYVDSLNKNYGLYLNLCLQIKGGSGSPSLYFNEFQPAFETLKNSVKNINDLNMQAVVRKSQITKHDSARIVDIMAVIGIFCLILAFGYFWYFPFYVSSSVAYLSNRMKGLLKDMGITLDVKTNDEAQVILQAINLLENRLKTKDNKKS